MAEPLLTVRGLSVAYLAESADVVAVDAVDLDVADGEFLAIVGESGCGKSTLLFAIAGLLSPPAQVIAGEIRFRGTDMARLDDAALRHLRWRDFSVVLQSAMNALNPMKSIEAQFGDAMRAHLSGSGASKAAIHARTAEVLRLVGIDPVHASSYPHQLSGGMRQRAMIAMALLFTPQLVIMDEPSSALDVVAQRSLMRQVKDLQQSLGFAVVFVTHDMSLVRSYSDRLMVMYAGQLAELAPTESCFERPLHPYSRGLLDAFPSIRGPRVPLFGIPGSPPDLAHPPAGCRFAPRCPRVMDRCLTTEPDVFEVGASQVRCLLYDGLGTGAGVAKPAGVAS
ncbi:MAG TPA: ABC transporter ATP-binding protein [Candidatus Dormibacteraeota bacterium]|nr:ABC transporter ATP-binding protein [Candidatus Dormibacteraeota bacterium]